MLTKRQVKSAIVALTSVGGMGPLACAVCCSLPLLRALGWGGALATLGAFTEPLVFGVAGLALIGGALFFASAKGTLLRDGRGHGLLDQRVWMRAGEPSRRALQRRGNQLGAGHRGTRGDDRAPPAIAPPESTAVGILPVTRLRCSYEGPPSPSSPSASAPFPLPWPTSRRTALSLPAVQLARPGHDAGGHPPATLIVQTGFDG